MTWILLLLQLIPVIIDIIQKIRELLRKLPADERRLARREMNTLARRQVHELTRKHSVLFAQGLKAGDVEKQRQALQDKVSAEWQAFEKRVEDRIAHHSFNQNAEPPQIFAALAQVLQNASAPRAASPRETK